MVSKWDMEKFIKENADKFPYVYKEEDQSIYDKDGNYLASLDDFLEIYRKKSGESFESIYSEHVCLENVLRCTECGTVIFTKEDERYDPLLKCPTCTDYHTYFEYWTSEDIKLDEEKQDAIKFFKEMTERRVEQNKRMERRKGKYDWEIAVKKFQGKKIFLELALECNDITESYFKGLRLKVHIGKKTNNNSYIITKRFTIPLGW